MTSSIECRFLIRISILWMVVDGREIDDDGKSLMGKIIQSPTEPIFHAFYRMALRIRRPFIYFA